MWMETLLATSVMRTVLRSDVESRRSRFDSTVLGVSESLWGGRFQDDGGKGGRAVRFDRV